MKGPTPAHLREWDYWLTVATVLLLGTLALQSLIGTAIVWWGETTVPAWQSFGAPRFIEVMNLIAAPQVIALVLIMGLCVPKRLFDRTALVVVSVAMLAVGAVAWAWTGSATTGLAAFLALSALIQVGVVALTLAGVRGPSYLTEGRLVKAGSGLLHLGFIIFAYVVVAMQDSAFMLPVFWMATALSCVGSLMSFYADRFAFKKTVHVPVEHSFADPPTRS